MKIKRRFNVVKLSKLDFLLKYNILILMTALFVSGLIIGASMFKNENLLFQNTIENIFIRFNVLRGTENMAMVFVYSLLINMTFIGSAFTFGMCLIGTPVICLLPFFRGIGYGMLTGFMYNSYGLDGVGNFTLTILPGAVLAVSLLIISCNESYKTTLDLLRLVTKGNQMQETSMKRYLSFYIIMIILIIVASLIDMILIKVFSPLFVLV